MRRTSFIRQHIQAVCRDWLSVYVSTHAAYGLVPSCAPPRSPVAGDREEADSPERDG